MSVEIYAERLDILHSAKVGLAVFGAEVVVVVGYVAKEVDVPTLVRGVGEISLIVDERGLVLALGVERA